MQVVADVNGLPDEKCFTRWVNSALDRAGVQTSCRNSVVVRIVDAAESRSLNDRYRGKDRPTNVLAFPAATSGLPLADDDDVELGDLVVCAAVVAQEAAEQGKSLEAHYAHMIVHGSLHLAGYDHLEEAEARKMESLETELLAALGYGDPYREAG